MASSSISVQILGDSSGFRNALDESTRSLSGFAKNIGKIGAGAAVAGGLAIGAGVVKGVTSALDRADIVGGLANNLGLTEAQAEEAGQAAASAYGKGFGESFDENASIASTLAGLGVAGVDALTEQTRQATAITETFAVDQAELLASTSALINRGFVESTSDAFDLLTTSAQGSFIPLSEQLDLMNEYGDQIAQVGLTGEQAFGLISTASSSFEADKILDTFKELAIRGQDMSNTSVDALETLGLNADEVAKSFALGGTAAGEARDDILKALGETADETERNTLGVALMGTAYEDLGLDPLAKLNAVGRELEVSAENAETLADKSLTARDRLGALGRRGENALAQLGEALLPFVEQAMPQLEAGLQTAITLFEQHFPAAIQFVQQTLQDLQPVFQAVLDIAVVVADWFRENWPAISAVVLEVFGAIADWVAENWPTIQEIIVEVMTVVGEIITATVELVGAIWERWGDELLLVVETVFGAIGPIISNVLDVVLGLIRTVTSIIKGDWSAAWDNVKETLAAAWDAIQAIVDGGLELLSVGLEVGLDAISKVFGATWDGIVGGFKAAINAIIDLWNGLDLSIPAVKVLGQTVFPGVGDIVPDIPRLHTGGTVPGGKGQERLYMLEGGERVLSRDEVRGGQGPAGTTIGTVILHDGRDFFDMLDRRAALA